MSYVSSLMEDFEDQLVDNWLDRLFDHPESLYQRGDIPELEQICRDGMKASKALIEGRSQPKIVNFVDELLELREQYSLESADLLRFFWELRKTVIEFADAGGDPGQPDWKELHDEVDTCVEIGVINIVDRLESNS